jgi:hypothetical protein
MYFDLALVLMFSKVSDVGGTLLTRGLQYRNGKTVDDLIHARKKALKAGLGRTETEISMLEVYLKQVLKKL